MEALKVKLLFGELELIETLGHLALEKIDELTDTSAIDSHLRFISHAEKRTREIYRELGYEYEVDDGLEMVTDTSTDSFALWV